MPMEMEGRVLRAQARGILELPLCAGPVPVIEPGDGRAVGVCLAEHWVELERLRDRGLRLGHRFQRRHNAEYVEAEQGVGRCCTGVGPRILWIRRDRLIESLERD